MSAQDPYAKYGGSVAEDPYEKYGGAVESAPYGGKTLAQRQADSKAAFEANQPKSVIAPDSNTLWNMVRGAGRCSSLRGQYRHCRGK